MKQKHQLRFIILFVLIGMSKIVKADDFKILNREREALQCRIDLTFRAENEILISTYIIRADEVGLGLLQIMIDKAAKGVKVKLILDAFGNDIPLELMNYLIEKKVEVHLFHKARLFQLHTLTNRMHEKVFISDNLNLIVGGRNLSNDYFKIDSTGNFLDTELYVQSKPVSNELRTHFFTMWNKRSLTKKPSKVHLTDEMRTEWKIRLAEGYTQMLKKGKVQPNSKINWNALTSTAKVYATYDNFVPDSNLTTIIPAVKKNLKGTHQLIALLDSAKTAIDFKNPYFHPTKLWKTAIKNAIGRGVKVRLLTNSECTNDVLLMQAVYRRSRSKYLKMGVQIWEYEGKEYLHTKSIIIDSATTVIGSYNIHIVSQKNNSEVCLWVKDKKFGLQNIHYMDNNLADAKLIEATKRNLSNWHFDKHPNCPKKAFKYCLYVHLFAPIMGLFM